MAELYVHLNQAGYKGGDTLYGPTSATGVTMNIVGYENYHYSNLQATDPLKREIYFQDTKEYVQCTDIHLFSGEVPYAIGRYVLPFQVRLPKDIPASFRMTSESGVKWEIRSTYGIKVQLIGEESTHEEKEFMVFQTPFNNRSSNLLNELVREYKTEAPQAGLFGHLRPVPLTIKLRIDKPTYNSEECIKLHLEFDLVNRNKAPKILQVNVKLEREVYIIFRKNRETGSINESLDEMNFGNILSVLSNMCGKHAEESSTIKPEGDANIIWESTIKEARNTNLIDGFSLLIPLEKIKFDDVNSPQTSIGHHFVCMYKVTAEIDIKGMNRIPMAITIPSVEISPKKLPNDMSPGWSDECKVLSGDHRHEVPKDILESEVYSKFPSFQKV